jgi:hypothetical protein
MIGNGISVENGEVSLSAAEAAAFGNITEIRIVTMIIVKNGETTFFKLILSIFGSLTLNRRDLNNQLFYTKTLVPDTIADEKKQSN